MHRDKQGLGPSVEPTTAPILAGTAPPGPTLLVQLATCLNETVTGVQPSENLEGFAGHCTQEWAAGSCGLKPSAFP